ncbi:MAG: acylphosphatase [Candidatus Diapherotrites archaeon]|nr:acylphosphatase [Candidatus Diapherotrites archaeon]
MTEINAFVIGRVQGVGFRYFVVQKAKKLGLTGFVRNVTGGKVEIVAQGSKEKLELLIEILKEGGYIGHVEEVKVEWRKETKKFDEFSIEF